MKKAIKTMLPLLLVAGMVMLCGTTTSCKSSETMYRSKNKTAKVVNKNYKVRGTNQRNGSTYRTY